MSIASVESNLKKDFKNFGHAIASGAKYFADELVPGAVKVAQKAEQLQPEADLLLSILAGPQAKAINDLAMNVFGQVVNSLVPLSQDQLGAVQAKGLNIILDQQVVTDIQAAAAVIMAALKAKGTPAPAPTPVPQPV